MVFQELRTASQHNFAESRRTTSDGRNQFAWSATGAGRGETERSWKDPSALALWNVVEKWQRSPQEAATAYIIQVRNVTNVLF